MFENEEGEIEMYFPTGIVYDVDAGVTVPYLFSTPVDHYWIHVRTAATPNRVLVGDESVAGSRSATHQLYNEPLVFERREVATTTTTTTTRSPTTTTPPGPIITSMAAKTPSHNAGFSFIIVMVTMTTVMMMF